MVVTFFPDGTRCGELLNPSREGDAKTFLGGKEPGELCDNDETNPIVWDGRRQRLRWHGGRGQFSHRRKWLHLAALFSQKG